MMNSEKSKDISSNYSAKRTSSVSDELTEATIDLTIPIDCVGLRLDQALARLLPDWSRNRLQAWILESRVMLNGEVPTPKQKVWGNEQIQITPNNIVADSIYMAEAIKLDIVYEDATILVINKPVGLVVHPGNGNWQGTMLNALLHHATQLNHVPRAGIVHRLDKNTSGLLVVAKTIAAQTSLVRQLQQHTVKRDYLALVYGQVEQNGHIDAPIGRHPTQRTKMAVTEKGKPARTHYQVLENLEGCTLLQCSLETGRTHQIRVHMHKIGHPLVGDPTYVGKPKGIKPEIGQLLVNFPRQALHAQRLELTHPQNKQIVQWETQIPDDMKMLLEVFE